MRKPFSCSRTFLPLIAVLLSIDAYSDCVNDFRSNKSGGVAVTDVTILGTQTVSSKLLGDMTSTLVGACFNDSSEELGERVKALFLDRGYFAVEVKNVKIKPGDPLAVPKPIVLEAGELQVFAEKEIAAKLRANWQLAEGAVFDSSYVSKYFSDNRSILSSLTPKSIQVVTDCPRAVATVRILVNAFDPGAQIPAENVPCDSP